MCVCYKILCYYNVRRVSKDSDRAAVTICFGHVRAVRVLPACVRGFVVIFFFFFSVVHNNIAWLFEPEYAGVPYENAFYVFDASPPISSLYLSLSLL